MTLPYYTLYDPAFLTVILERLLIIVNLVLTHQALEDLLNRPQYPSTLSDAR